MESYLLFVCICNPFPRQTGICLINFRFFGSLLFQKVFDINGEIVGEFMIHNLFSQ